MAEPTDYFHTLDFNTKSLPSYHHISESSPAVGEGPRLVRVCRCWQSNRFPYCDDTHKYLEAAGDSVGPMEVTILAKPITTTQVAATHALRREEAAAPQRMFASAGRPLETQHDKLGFPGISSLPASRRRPQLLSSTAASMRRLRMLPAATPTATRRAAVALTIPVAACLIAAHYKKRVSESQQPV
eukprot:Selendium_serpulae@DN5697_c0_g1_i5.p1